MSHLSESFVYKVMYEIRKLLEHIFLHICKKDFFTPINDQCSNNMGTS